MSENGSLATQLMDIKGGARGIEYDDKRDRFNMPYCAETSVGDNLNANRIIIGGNAIAIATQYPYPHQVEAQLQLMVDNCTPVLVVLASSTDIQNHQLPVYFSGSGTFDKLQTQSRFEDYIDLGSDIETKLFKLTISGSHGTIDIPVLHVYNWPDQRTVSPDTTSKLVTLIESTIAERRGFHAENNNPVVNDSEKMLPIIHCKAGVGRSGQTIAAMAMKRYPELSLETITKDLRASRNDRMVQTSYQMKTLVKMANGIPTQNKQQPQKKSALSWRSLFGK